VTEDWSRPTPCPSWSVRDVVAHLVEGELLFGRVCRGELDPVAATDLDNEAGVERWRRTDGETVRYSLWHHGQATQRVIDSRSDASWRRRVRIPGAELELRALLRVHFFELALHSHDVTAALGASHLWGDRVEAVVQYCLRGAPAVLARAGLAPEGSIAVRVAGVGTWTLDGSGEAWRLAPDGAAGAAASWEVDPETLVLATAGRLTADDAASRSAIEGDAGLLGRALAVWRVTG
jgi:uncharacterized protein (TIGR03083 family)